MWFKNALVYQIENMPSVDVLEDSLNEHAIKPCPPHARHTYGWLPVMNDSMLHTVNGASLFVMGKEERILPPSVLNQLLEEKIEALELSEGRSMRRSEKNQMKEEMEFTLLPKSFTVMKKTWAFYDKTNARIVVNTSSPTVGEQICSLLIKAINTIGLTPLSLDIDIRERFTRALSHSRSLPAHFDLGQRCVLQAPDEETKRFTCKGYELPAEEVDGLLKRGLQATELSFVFHDRLHFTFTDKLVFKNIKCAEILQDELKDCEKLETGAEQLDSSFVLMVGELSELFENVFNLLLNIDTTFPLQKEAVHLQDNLAELSS